MRVNTTLPPRRGSSQESTIASVHTLESSREKEELKHSLLNHILDLWEMGNYTFCY